MRSAKPLVGVLLIGLAFSLDADPAIARWLVVGGLACCLVGDVLLMPSAPMVRGALRRPELFAAMSDERRPRRSGGTPFLQGAGAFLVGHGFYIAAFSTMDLAGIGIVGGVAAALVLFTYLGWPIVRRVRGGPMALPVIGYMVVVGALVVLATATHRWPIAAGGVLFALSDGLLGLDRFVTPAPRRRRLLMHLLSALGQLGFVLGLAWSHL